MKENESEILSSISHDLKSPMVALLGFVRILERELKKGQKNSRCMEMIKRINVAGNQINGLIEDILMMAKMEAGKEKIEPVPVLDLREQLSKTLTTFELEAKAKDIRLYFHVKNSLPKVKWDIKRLRLHVINNLLSNALKFTPKGGIVILTVESTPEGIMITVEDTGIGIPENELESIFKPFESSDTLPVRAFGGTGLGLSNARKFVKIHGGCIYAKKKYNQKGACFEIKLPNEVTNSLFCSKEINYFWEKSAAELVEETCFIAKN